ncbi:MAG: hypothetical protein J5642_06410 [Bacteroidales bacterium]|nr:hypothetical protein [Bacteroidales bacterium]
MKKTFFLILTLIIFCGTISAQQDCPAVDCPGMCGRFVDADGDGFCDHGKLSKPKAEPKTEPAVQQQTPPPMPTHKVNVVQNEESGVQEQTAPQDTTPEKSEVTDNEKAGYDALQAGSTQQPEEKAPAKPTSPYHVYLILGGTLLLYLISFILVKANVWTKVTHRKVWNVALTITFLVSCLLGLLLAIFIHHGYRPECYITLLKLHVWFGIAMTVIAFFHALWHLNYFKAIFKSNKSNS